MTKCFFFNAKSSAADACECAPACTAFASNMILGTAITAVSVIIICLCSVAVRLHKIIAVLGLIAMIIPQIEEQYHISAKLRSGFVKQAG